MTFNLSLFLHEVLYTAYLLASWLCLTWLIRFVELVCCALFSSFCFELYNSFNSLLYFFKYLLEQLSCCNRELSNN